MTTPIAIHWFRQDLRLSDNPALNLAAACGRVLPIYILDDKNAGEYAMGGASRCWLHHSLASLNKALGGHLCLYRGDAAEIFNSLAKRFTLKAVYWNRCYEPWRREQDENIREALDGQDIQGESCNGSLLWEPWRIKKADGDPYKVFTPFYRKGCLQAEPPREPVSSSDHVTYHYDKEGTLTLEQLGLLPQKPWSESLHSHWEIGEESAHTRFEAFIEEGLPHYKEGRDFPAKPYVSRLSPHLHFGEISPHQLWHSLRAMGDHKHIEHFCSELAWREFSYSQLFYHPQLPVKNLHEKFDNFPWVEDKALLRQWQKGQTGIPMVDAGMRELWQTGYMHNRVRMIVGSFLVKNLRLHWHHGERWFWDTLVDADLANNSASWQWIAGCGADAAPYFRIFNPVTQGKKYDPDGDYIRRFIPEIASLPNRYLFSPWEAPEDTLKEAKITLGSTYPEPIVDLKVSREAALAAFKSIKK